MPASLTTTLLALGLVLAVCGFTLPAVIAAFAALGWEVAVTVTSPAPTPVPPA